MFADSGQQHQARPPNAAPGHDPARTMIAGQGGLMGQQQYPGQHPGQHPGMPPPGQGRPMMPMPPGQAPAHTPTTPQGHQQHDPRYHGNMQGQPATVVMGGDGAVQVRQSASHQTAKNRKRKKQQTSSAVFWMLCIIAGILIGIVAYLIVSNVTH
jgi:hypothetical protein